MLLHVLIKNRYSPEMSEPRLLSPSMDGDLPAFRLRYRFGWPSYGGPRKSMCKQGVTGVILAKNS